MIHRSSLAFRLWVLLLLSGVPVSGVWGQAATSSSQLESDLRFLADDRLEGRRTGSPGADSAAAYIARRFAASGLHPAGSLGSWFQTFVVAPTAPAAHGTDLTGASGQNVVGVLRGRDPSLADDYVVIGAHYDHLGLGGQGSLDPSTRVVHNGADDNASGVVALLEIARRLALRPPARSVVFVAFSGEELGRLGSSAFVTDAVVPKGRMTVMLNFDMVGRLRDDRLVVYGVETAAEWRRLLESLNATHRFALNLQHGGYGPSDHTSFTVAGVPVLHFFTGTHEDYHRSTDDWPRINIEGIERIAALAADVARAVADRDAPLTFVHSPPPTPPSGGNRSSGYGAYLGTVPDMTDNPGGVRLSGVRAGSPAEQAGLRAGDIITRIGDHRVGDLQAMTDALRAYQAGASARLVFLRDGREHRVTVTFGLRGGG
ncbi:MAG TPA: M28 family peptidase [Gemmatimonadales bacterium]